MSPDVVTAVQAERAKAAAILEACDAFLNLFEPAPAIHRAYQRKPPEPRRVPKAPKVPTPPAPVAATPSSDSKVSRYADVIVKALQHHTLAPHHSADRAVLNREIAKACGIKPDALMPGDVANALQKLKAAGTIERTGTVWALVQKP